MTDYKLICGDALEVLKKGKEKSFQCCITSPPYYSLRDYGTATWEGGNENCDHRQQLGGEGTASSKQNTSVGTQTVQYKDTCHKCGAKRTDKQIGLEKTPYEYIDSLVLIFREVRRLLKDNGLLFVNIGDSYAGSGGPGSQYDNKAASGYKGEFQKFSNPNRSVEGIKSKDLIGIPWMLAFALRTDNWYLRQDLIWEKPNCMPESVKDRCTKSHEYIFMLAKSRTYFYNAIAIAEPLKESSIIRNQTGWNGNEERNYTQGKQNHFSNYLGSEKAKVQTTRNKRSVWTIPTKSFRGAHFATFPEALVEPMILAGSSEKDWILDPFAGACTTGVVALKNNRRFIGIDLNEKYVEMGRARIEKEVYGR